MSNKPAKALRELVRRTHDFGDGCGQRKLELLRTLERQRLTRAPDVLKLHEALCFLRAYPDNASLLAQVERMLAGFDRRSDLRRNREELANTGIAGTPIYFRFFADSALRLARRWGKYLTIDWDEFERQGELEPLLPLLTLYCETPALDEYAFDIREWIERLKGPGETDAEFLLRRIERLRMSSRAREVLLDHLDIPLCLSPGPDTPARTHEKYVSPSVLARDPIVYQNGPVARSRPTPAEIAERSPAARYLKPTEARAVIELARSAMATRSRDLDAFAYATEHDVRLVDCDAGLRIALIGVMPERRLMLETLYGYIVLKNGVPVGYGTITALFNSAEVAYTIFDTFRSGEAAHIFGWVLTIAHRLFDADTMMIDPYQIGKDNDDAIRSGAWWFYQKLGFAPRDPEALRIMRRELRRMKSRRGHRSSAPTLKQLAEHNVFLNLDRLQCRRSGRAPHWPLTGTADTGLGRYRIPGTDTAAHRDDILGILPLANVGLQVTKYLARHFGADREKATRECSRQARELLGLRSSRRLSPGERLAWNRWAPLVMVLPGLGRWSSENKRALVKVIRAKGGPRESDYLEKFNAHRRFRTALRKLAGRDAET